MLCVLLAVVIGAMLVYLAYSRQPELNGTIAHASLRAPVQLVRDTWGVPHITAENETDAYFALGYAQAQDRLFQMELARRLAQGTLSEILGPKLVKVDSIVRAFRLRKKSEANYANMEKTFPELKAVCDAYVAGINHRLEREALPFEFAVLAIPARPFTPVDCLSIGALLPITFSDGLRGDSLSTMLKAKHPTLDIDALFPGYGNETPVTVMESLEEAQGLLAAANDAATAAQTHAPRDVQGLQALLACLQPISDLFGPALGSNSWVIAPERTKSGKPILANDPHIGFTNPSVWYEAHLKFAAFESYGFHLPLIPFPLIAHNEHHAWSLTMFANDDVDLFLETFDKENPNRVKYKGEWVDVTVERETIPVRFGDPVEIDVRLTPHGPVITDFLRAVVGYEGPDVSLSWVWQHVEYTDMGAFYKMGHAADYDAFAAAMPLITSPGLNVSYADSAGNIAWWAAGTLPVRPPHVNPKQLLDGGSGKDEVLGYVPFALNPHLKNPASGYIVTANNMSTVKPVGDLPQLQGYWQPTDRAGRIEELIEPRSDWTIDDLRAVQFDDTGRATPQVVSAITGALAKASTSIGDREQEALELLSAWDFRHDADSQGAAVYQVLTDFILTNALRDEMGPGLFKTYGTLADHWNFFKRFIGDDASRFWDDVSTSNSETREQIIARSLTDTVTHLDAKLGRDTAAWKWGALHTMEFKHPFGYLPGLGGIFNVGPFPASGGAQLVNNMLYHLGAQNFSVIAGPSTRRLIDFAEPTNALVILPTGNSGNFMSPNYGDQAPLFMRGEYRTAWLTPEQIKQHQSSALTFKPN
ncbi:MAG TPA: penicillin acylase family protein [Candidatus Hydrogenedentes bacterium]|nr:penicillin acylase family protein [Candidatus Hydrogenedentota bacterium]